MKMFLIIYCEAADEAVIAALKEAGVRGYTKMVEARGRGRKRNRSWVRTSGPGRTMSF